MQKQKIELVNDFLPKRFIGLYGYGHDSSRSITTTDEKKVLSNRHIEFERTLREKRVGNINIELIEKILLEDYDSQINLVATKLDQIQKFLNIPETLEFFKEYINLNFDDNKVIKHPMTGHNIMLVGHHLAHAAYSYYSRPLDMEETDVFVYDGRGIKEDSLFLDKNLNPSPINNIGLGMLWDDCSRVIYNDTFCEGKIMGLSAYGKYNKELEKYFIDYTTDFLKYNECFGGDGYPNTREVKVNDIKKILNFAQGKFKNEDIAKTIQKFSEIYVIEYLKKNRTSENLCLSGGVALNGYINQKLVEEKVYKKVYIPPACNDSGVTQGANMFAVNKHISWRPQEVRYIGNKYSYFDMIKKEIPYDEIYKYIAQKLREKKIIAWYQGRSESGPRALGNRSILCDPTFPDMKDYINEKVKHREWYRPFAPAILKEHVTEWFENVEDAPNMLKICRYKQGMGEKVPSVCHEDYTGRVQTVTEESNEHFYNLIKEFHKLSGVPILLNTSFNDNGEPIVDSPKDAIKTFKSTEIDILVLHNYIYEKE